MSLLLLVQFNVGFTEVVYRQQEGERGEGAYIYICQHQTDFRIEMGSEVSHFTVSLIIIVQGKVMRQCP